MSQDRCHCHYFTKIVLQVNSKISTVFPTPDKNYRKLSINSKMCSELIFHEIDFRYLVNSHNFKRSETKNYKFSSNINNILKTI